MGFVIRPRATYVMVAAREPRGMLDRAELEVEDLLKLVLVLVVVWLAIEIVGEVVGTLAAIAGPIVGLLIAAIIVLWLLDRI